MKHVLVFIFLDVGLGGDIVSALGCARITDAISAVLLQLEVIAWVLLTGAHGRVGHLSDGSLPSIILVINGSSRNRATAIELLPLAFLSAGG